MSDEIKPEPSSFSRRDFVRIAAGVAGVSAAGLALPRKGWAPPPPPKPTYDAPVITCGEATETSIRIHVCAGASGTPAGFTIQWMTCADYEANGNQWYSSDDPRACDASFSGNARDSRYALGANGCLSLDIVIGELLFDEGTSTSCPEALECGTCYVFRAFAHGDNNGFKSDFTANLECSTLDCSGCPEPPNCTYTQGYWKTHGPEGCVTGNNSNEWPVTSLTLGTVLYTDLQLCSILNTPAAGNGLITLAHQLIAAKLNVAKGADGTDAASCIAAADTLIGGLVIPPVGSGSLAPSATSALVTCLTNYNEGATGPGHCC